MFYNFYVTLIRYKNYKLLCRNSIALSYFCASNIVVLQRLFIIRKRILMTQNLTKKTIKMPQKIAKNCKKAPKKAQKSLNKSFKTHFTKKYLLNLNDF